MAAGKVAKRRNRAGADRAKTAAKPVPVREILAHLRARQVSMVRLLGEFVRCESFSYDKKAVDAFGAIVAGEWKNRRADVRVMKNKDRGNNLRIEVRLSNNRPTGQLLVIGHLDTVYPAGTIAKTPFRVSAGRALGPGTFDMKGGLVLALFAVDALRTLKLDVRKKFVFLWTSDEEIGSEASRATIEAEARRSDAVLVLEPSFGAEGKLKTQRKGVGGADVLVTGKSAHAGIDPEKGVNAVHELALQIERLMQLNDSNRGITVQATVIEGGTISNVVPARARAEVDIRFARLADGAGIERKIHALKPILRGAHVKITGGVNRPPLERTPAIANLFRTAQSLMRAMGLDLGEASTGGGSDGNFTAAQGVPTLDGLGCVGDGAHSPGEHVLIRALPERAALLAALLASL
jgi:glutamate carboxypeptidase